MELMKFADSNALAVCENFKAGLKNPPENNTVTSSEFLKLLLEDEKFSDVICFLACGLPKREGVWWSCVCINVSFNEYMTEEERNAIVLVENWVKQPNEDNRYLLEPVNQTFNFESPVGWVAQAAFWSGESILPRDKPKVPPGNDLTAKAIFGAIQLAVVKDAQKSKMRYKECIIRGIDIANGGNGKKQSAQWNI